MINHAGPDSTWRRASPSNLICPHQWAHSFTAHELAILERVALFVNGFETAAELSEYSHKEKLWIENDDGRPLSYLDAYELNGLEKFIEA